MERITISVDEKLAKELDAIVRERGPDFAKAARLPATPPGQARAATRLWAGFVLSGAGR